MYAYDDYTNTPDSANFAEERLTNIEKTDDANLEFNYTLPSVLGLGVAYTNDQIQFELNIKQYSKIDEYNLVGSSDRFQQQQTNQMTIVADVLHKAGEPDAHVSAAFSYALNKDHQLTCGVFNDPSFVDESFFFDGVDLTGVVIGVDSQYEESSTSYGLYSTSGSKDNDGIVKTYSAIGVVVSGSMYF